LDIDSKIQNIIVPEIAILTQDLPKFPLIRLQDSQILYYKKIASYPFINFKTILVQGDAVPAIGQREKMDSSAATSHLLSQTQG
jgi:hypothetical protein